MRTILAIALCSIFAFNIEAKMFLNGTLSKKIANKIYKGVSFNKKDWSGYRFENVRFIKCTFKQVKFKNSILNHVIFKESKFFKTDFRLCRIKFSKFLHSKVQYSYFSNALIYGSDFLYSDLRWSNFSHAILNSIRFENSRLSHAIWKNGKPCLKGSISKCKQKIKKQRKIQLHF